MESLSAAKRSLVAMKEVKTKVDAILYNSILNGSVLYLEAFQGAVFEAVEDTKKTKGGIVDTWTYFAKKERVWKVSRDKNREQVLRRWRKKCTWWSHSTLSEIIGTDSPQGSWSRLVLRSGESQCPRQRSATS